MQVYGQNSSELKQCKGRINLVQPRIVANSARDDMLLGHSFAVLLLCGWVFAVSIWVILQQILSLGHCGTGRLEVKSAKLQPYFFMCCQCFAMASPMSHIKYISRNGQYTGTRKIQNQVHTQVPSPISSRLFQRLNSVMERRTGRSPSVLRRMDTLSSRKRVLSASSSSGSGRPEGVKYWTMRQMTQSPMIYMSPRYQQVKILQRMQAQKNTRYPQRSRFQQTALSTTVWILRSTSQALLFSINSDKLFSVGILSLQTPYQVVSLTQVVLHALALSQAPVSLLPIIRPQSVQYRIQT